MHIAKHNITSYILTKIKNVFSLDSSLFGLPLLLSFFGGSAFTFYQKEYARKVYPNVYVGDISFGGKTPQEVENYWRAKNDSFPALNLNFIMIHISLLISGTDLDLGYDAPFRPHRHILLEDLPTDLVTWKLYCHKNTSIFSLFR